MTFRDYTEAFALVLFVSGVLAAWGPLTNMMGG
jgi:hypothetical protein